MTSSPFVVTVRPFTSPTPSSCAYERGNTSSRNAIVFIGGLTSGPHTSPQMEHLIQALQDEPELSYSFWEFRMRSSYTGFGYSSLANDAEDIAAHVKYLEDLGKERVVLLGSSTGCQAILTYANLNNLCPIVSAYILQAQTSDRETAGLLMPPDFYATTLKHAAVLIERGEKDEVMPKVMMDQPGQGQRMHERRVSSKLDVALFTRWLQICCDRYGELCKNPIWLSPQEPQNL